jgi:hypothetical protein
MKVYLNKSKILNLVCLDYDIINDKPDIYSDLAVLCVQDGMDKAHLIEQLRNMASEIENVQGDVMVMQ